MTGQVISNNGRTIALNRLWEPTPDYTAPTVFKIGTGTTDPTVSDTDIETGVNINGGATKTFVSGYPILDEATIQATIRAILLTTEGNGNDLTEFALFNTDGSPKMFSRTVHTVISKTSSVQIIYVEKDKVS